MIILDTDVLSAAIRENPEPKVVAWMDARRFDEMWITSVTMLEILVGIEEMPRSRRRDTLEDSFLSALRGFFRDRVLPFDHHAAFEAGRLHGRRRRAGRTIAFADTQIAGIALSQHATVATGNVSDFADLGVRIVNPWQAKA